LNKASTYIRHDGYGESGCLQILNKLTVTRTQASAFCPFRNALPRKPRPSNGFARHTAKQKEKSMDKRVIAHFTLVVVTISIHSQALSQSRCSLTEATSPSVRGLRLGMSIKSYLALFSGSATRWRTSRRRPGWLARKQWRLPSSGPVYLLSTPPPTGKGQFTSVDSGVSRYLKGA